MNATLVSIESIEELLKLKEFYLLWICQDLRIVPLHVDDFFNEGREMDLGYAGLRSLIIDVV